MERAEVVTISYKLLKLRYIPTYSFQSDEHRVCYSLGRSCEVDSSVDPERIHKNRMKMKHENNETAHDNTTEKPINFFGINFQENSGHIGTDYLRKNELFKTKYFMFSDSDSVNKMKVNIAKNKNQTLRLAKRTSENIRRSSLIDLSEGQENARNDVIEDEVKRLSYYDGERDENRNYLHSNCKGYKDFIVLSSDDDYDTAMVFRDELLKLGIPDLTVDHFEDINLGKTEMESISSLNEQCNTVLIFVTHNYAKDKKRHRLVEMLLLKGMETEGLQQWVVPVWVEKDVKKSVLELATIKGIQYYELQKKKTNISKQITDLVMTGRGRHMF